MSLDGVEVTLDVESDLDVPVYGVAYALTWDDACLSFERFEGDGLEAPVRAAKSLADGSLTGVATFRGRAGGSMPGKRSWGRLHFRALAEGDCALRFDVTRSRVRGPDGSDLDTAWAGGAVRATPVD